MHKLGSPVIHRSMAFAAIAGLISIYSLVQYEIGLSARAASYWSDGFWTAAALIAAWRCHRTAKQLKNAKDARAWRFFALSSLSWGIGMLVWDYYELVRGVITPFPSGADFGFMGFALFFVLGSLCYHDDESRYNVSLKHVLNIAIVLCAVSAITALALHPSLHETTESQAYIAVAIAYPVIYGSALLFAVSWLWTSVSGPRRRAYALMVLALLFHTATDIVYSGTLLIHGYTSGQPLDVYWLIGFAIIYMAAIEAAVVQDNDNSAPPLYAHADPRAIDQPTETLVPGLSALAVVIAFIVFRDIQIDQDLVNILLGLAGVFVALLVMRELWTYLHQQRLFRALVLSQSHAAASAQELRNIFDKMSETFYRTDINGNVTMLSNSARDLLGYAPNEIIGRPLAEFYVSPGKRDEFLANLKANGGKITGQEMDMRHKDGRVVWVSTNAHFVTDDAGNVVGVEGTSRNITEQREMREALRRARNNLEDRVEERTRALRESQTTLSAFLDSTIDYAALVDRDLRFLVANKAMGNIYGVDPKELIGRAMFRTPPTATGQRRQQWVHRVFDTGQALRMADEADGQWFDNSYFPVFDETGAVSRVAIFARDITEQKKAEEVLRQLSRAVEQDPNAIFITDLEGTIQYVNSRFVQMTGYTAEEAIGSNPRILKSEETPRETYAQLWNAIKSGQEWRGEVKDRRKNGSYFWAHETIGPVKNEHGVITHFVATHEDITHRKEAEIAMREATERAEIANRAKTELMANMSHELRTPLNAIIGFSDAIAAETFGPMGNEKYLEYIGHIGASGEHLLALINDILDVSAVEAGRLELHEEDIVLGDLVEASVRLIADRATHKQVHLITDLQTDLPLLYADVRRMKQILLNLLSNAVKFTPEDGTITLSASMSEEDGYVISVTDTGIGMSPSELAKAMTQFGQVDSGLNRKEDGTGLGLPLTKGLVELHGGTFEVISAKGQGTTVTVTLPKERVVSMN